MLKLFKQEICHFNIFNSHLVAFSYIFQTNTARFYGQYNLYDKKWANIPTFQYIL